MPSAVLDTTVLVSAFLNEGGVSDVILQYAKAYASHIVTRDDDLLALETSGGHHHDAPGGLHSHTSH